MQIGRYFAHLGDLSAQTEATDRDGRPIDLDAAISLEKHGREGDLLIAISSSGKSPNIPASVSAARRVKASVITLSGFQIDNPLRKQGDINFWLPDGHYGFVEIAHLAICHAILDFSMGWDGAEGRPVSIAEHSDSP